MDLFFLKCKEKIPIDKLHLIGSLCIFIASKNEEISFIKINQLLKNITYDKFSKKEI